MPQPDIHRLLKFQKLLIDFQAIERRVYAAKRRTWENDTEHSYNLAMTAWFLSDYFSELDQSKVIKLALVHDLVELHAGDTNAYAESSILETKAEREAKAVKQLATEWQDFPSLNRLIAEYEAHVTKEAQFVYALDKLMPIMHTSLDKGYSWHKESITLDRLKAVKTDKIAVSPLVNDYYQQLIKILEADPSLFPAAKVK